MRGPSSTRRIASPRGSPDRRGRRRSAPTKSTANSCFIPPPRHRADRRRPPIAARGGKRRSRLRQGWCTIAQCSHLGQPSGPAIRERIMQLGALLPLGDIGGDPEVVREYAQAAEVIGYDFLEAPDHVLGVNAASRPGWERNDNDDLFHDPFVLFGYLAGCTTRLGFSTGVLILPQRQTALVAKQAACLDVLCGGRFRLGIGVGWNDVEFVGLNENFHNRGRRSEEQVEVMQALWAEPHVSFQGRWHNIEDAGINPRPASGKVPVWFGGHHERTLERIARRGDGWMPNAYPPGREAEEVLAKLRSLTERAGRDPAQIGIEVWVSVGSGGEADWAAEARFWKGQGATHLCLTTTFNRRHHRRIPGHSLADHLAALRRYHAAVAAAL